jgi:putative redox protein
MYREATVQSGDDGFRQIITIGPHELTSDLPAEEDGGETGPSPHDLLLAALGSCTAMTIKWLAKKERMPLQHVEVRLSQSRSGEGHLFRLSIELEGDLNEAQRAALLAAAPV